MDGKRILEFSGTMNVTVKDALDKKGDLMSHK